MDTLRENLNNINEEKTREATMIGQEDIIYFILTDRFCDGDTSNNEGVDKSDLRKYHGGDFAGIINRIPYLKKLGVTALWITPIYLNIGRFGDSDSYHGYWTMDFEKVDPHLYSANPELAEGSKQYLKELVDALHQEGIKLILDMVVNHTGYHTDNYRDHHSPHIRDDWFNVGHSDEKKGALAGLPDLNHSKPDVVDYFVNNILSWIEEACIDAIRMDTVKHVEDAFWYFFKSYIKGKYRNITLIGEVLNFDVHSISNYQREHDFDTLFDFPLTAKIKETFVHNGSMQTLARPRISNNEPRGILDMDKFYTNANRLVTLLDNHDLDKRFMTEILDRWGHWDRIRAKKIFKLALTFLFTTRGIPQIYYGTEIGMEGRRDPDNRRDMPWEIFDEELVPKPGHADEREIFLYTQKLIQIRKQNPAIQHGYLFTLFTDHFIYAYMREYKGDVIIIVINNGLEDMPFPLRISIDNNSNIPIRIKEILRDKTLTNLLDKSDKIPVFEGNIQVKLTGKEGKIYASGGQGGAF